ncbi:MAG TPA: hypothetical protein VKV96_18850 [Roseiarcus sp.]|nr:hypothetical protein [Roseiarcus sp.]
MARPSRGAKLARGLYCADKYFLRHDTAAHSHCKALSPRRRGEDVERGPRTWRNDFSVDGFVPTGSAALRANKKGAKKRPFGRRIAVWPVSGVTVDLFGRRFPRRLLLPRRLGGE